MKRYHTTMGTGDGIEAGIMREIPAHVDNGFWVYYDEAQAEISKSFDRGFERGFKEGLTQGKAARTESAKAVDEELHSAWQTGYDAAKADFASAQADDSDRKRLLNELYHDRARLERVVKDSCSLINTMLDFIDDKSLYSKEGRQLAQDEARNWVIGLGQQFVDTHDVE